MPRTIDKIQAYLDQAAQQLAQAKTDVATTESKDWRESLYEQTDEVQNILNKLLSKMGVITDQEINQLDEKLRETKKNIELSKAKETQKKILIAFGVIVAGFTALWLITKK